MFVSALLTHIVWLSVPIAELKEMLASGLVIIVPVAVF
jgi:hypothetical protein